jgi:hypothetical protein
MSFRTVAAFAASAALLATSANAEKLAKADVYINVLNCTDIRGSGVCTYGDWTMSAVHTG